MTLVSRAWRVAMIIKDALALLFLMIFFGALYMLLSGGPDPAQNRRGALLLDLSGVLVEQTEAPDPRGILLGELPVGGQFQVRDVVRALDLAAKDTAIKAVVLDLGGFWGGSQAALDEVGEALARVKAAKKPVFAHALAWSDDGYLLAAHADEIWVDPMGAAMFAGPGGTRPYFKGLIDRLSVTTNVFRVGKYKSFIEPYTRADQSPEAKQAEQALVDTLWQSWQDDIARLRPKAKLAPFIADPAQRVAEQGGDMAKAALANGIVDRVGDRTAFGKRIAALVGHDEDEGPGDFNHSSLENWIEANPPSSSGAAIGVVTVAGAIVDGQAGPGTAGGETIANLIDEAVASGQIKGLVLRIDSGGGSAFASEQIRRAAERAKARNIPVISSMSGAAASGGYWVALAGDRIYAQPTTITGSIGVFAVIPTFERAAPRIGVTGDGVSTTDLSGQPDILRGINEPSRKMLQAGVEDIYRRFLVLTATRRKMTVERVNEIAQGRVWDGGTARQLGLVDAFGTADDAIAEAARLAKIDPKSAYRVDLEPQQSFLSGLLSVVGIAEPAVQRQDIFARFVTRRHAEVRANMEEARQILSVPAIQARCVECPSTRLRFSGKGPLERFFDRVFS